MFLRRLCPVVAVALLLTSLVPCLAAGMQRGQAAPSFQVTSLSGQNITNANYGGYVLLVQFFATWCTPCREAIPVILKLNKQYGKQGLQVLGLSIDEGGDRVVKAFVQNKKIGYPVALADDQLQSAYGVRSVPTLFLINRKGQVIEKFMGISDETEQALETAIKAALADK